MYKSESVYLFVSINQPIFFTPVKRYLLDLFIAQYQIVTMRLKVRQMTLRWLKPYTSFMAIVASSS
jgi:hypothetical protein